MRLTGVVCCVVAGRHPYQCPCFPDLLSDSASGGLDALS
jgi:hypothetical protein